MRLRVHLLLVGFLLAASTVCAQESGKKEKFTYYYPEAFLTCTAVNGTDGLFQNPQDTFNVIRDEQVVAWLSLKYVPKETRTIKFVWYSPRGDRYHESKTLTVNKEEYFSKDVRLWQQIGIRDLDKLGLLGQWRVVAIVNGKPLEKEAKFTLVR